MTAKKSSRARTAKTKKTGGYKIAMNIVLAIVVIGAILTAGVFIYAASSLPAWDPQLLSGAKTTIVMMIRE